MSLGAEHPVKKLAFEPVIVMYCKRNTQQHPLSPAERRKRTLASKWRVKQVLQGDRIYRVIRPLLTIVNRFRTLWDHDK